MERKTDVVRRLVASGEYKAALKIAKDFRLGITKEQSAAMTLAYECMVHGRFYKQLGYDLDEKVEDGIAVLTGLYGRRSNDIHKQILESGIEDRKVHSGWNNERRTEVSARL